MNAPAPAPAPSHRSPGAPVVHQAPKLPIDSARGVSAELIRVVREQCGALATWAKAEPDRMDEAVHRIRQTTKKLRAIARLLRPGSGRSAFDRWNRRLRDEARRFAALRDAAVLVDTFDRVAVHDPSRAEMAARLRAPLVERHESARRAAAQQGLLPALTASVPEIEAWMLESIPTRLSAGDLRKGARAAHRRARRQLAALRGRSSDHALHELRKRCKVVRAQMELLARERDEACRLLANRLGKVSSLLGEDHDLFELQSWIRPRVEETDGAQRPWLLELLGRAEWKRGTLQSEALRVAEVALAESDSSFAERLLPKAPRRESA